MTMVGGHNNESTLELASLAKVFDSCFDRIVKLEEFTESSIVVERVHLLVD